MNYIYQNHLDANESVLGLSLKAQSILDCSFEMLLVWDRRTLNLTLLYLIMFRTITSEDISYVFYTT